MRATQLVPCWLFAVSACGPGAFRQVTFVPVPTDTATGSILIKLSDKMGDVSVTVGGRLVRHGTKGLRQLTITGVSVGHHVVRVTASSEPAIEGLIGGSPRAAPLDFTAEVDVTENAETAVLVAVPPVHWIAKAWYWLLIVPVAVMLALKGS